MHRQTLWLVSLLLLFLTACQNDTAKAEGEHVSIGKPLQEKIQRPSSLGASLSHTSDKQRGASLLGITVKDGKIIIDTHKTRDFLQEISHTMTKSLKKIKQDLRKEQISSPAETGIVVTDSAIRVDLNKTKHFMERWLNSMDSVVREVDRAMNEIEKNMP